MKQLCIICEGETEVNLVNNLLFERLYKTYGNIIPITLPTGNHPSGGKAKGGFRSSDGYNFAKKQIKVVMSIYKDFVHTTFFDLFRFPNDIPCYSEAAKINDVKENLYTPYSQAGFRVCGSLSSND